MFVHTKEMYSFKVVSETEVSVCDIKDIKQT